MGKLYGINVATSFTNMNQPLGQSAGLWCEVQEGIECLKGNGSQDIMSVVFHLGKEALKLAGINNPDEQLRNAISNGSALEKFRELVKAHGGSIRSLDKPDTHSPIFRKKVLSTSDGYISYIDTMNLGMIVVHLGGGRLSKKEVLDPTAGILFHKKIGDFDNPFIFE